VNTRNRCTMRKYQGAIGSFGVGAKSAT